MLCHLNYTIDKAFYRKYFFDNYNKGHWHKKNNKEFKKWWKIFNIEKVVEPITNDLGIKNLNILPRFSYQLENSTLDRHIDIDRIIGINFNLFEEMPEIIIEGKIFRYENALIDVGSKIHSVVTKDTPRLVLKYAIRNDWQEVYNILNKRKLIDHTKTYFDNPNYDLYESKILETDKQFIK